MESIKHNQCLKIRLEYDCASGHSCFHEFLEMHGLESIGGKAYAYFPDSARWTEEEINGMTEEERQDWQDIFDWDWTRYTLTDVSWKEWYAVVAEEELLPYRYTAQGHSQSDWAYLYLLGMDEHEAENLTEDFEQYAFDTPYYFTIDLIDCETGETITDEGISGIYDTTYDLRHLKCELKSALNAMGEIHPELRDSALEAVDGMDYTDIDNGF